MGEFPPRLVGTQVSATGPFRDPNLHVVQVSLRRHYGQEGIPSEGTQVLRKFLENLFRFLYRTNAFKLVGGGGKGFLKEFPGT